LLPKLLSITAARRFSFAALAGTHALNLKDSLKGKRIGIIISGGNIDLERLCSPVAA
jgi:threonine dehydratase